MQFAGKSIFWGEEDATKKTIYKGALPKKGGLDSVQI